MMGALKWQNITENILKILFSFPRGKVTQNEDKVRLKFKLKKKFYYF